MTVVVVVLAVMALAGLSPPLSEPTESAAALTSARRALACGRIAISRIAVKCTIRMIPVKESYLIFWLRDNNNEELILGKGCYFRYGSALLLLNRNEL